MRLQPANAGAAALDRLIFPLQSKHVVVMIHVVLRAAHERASSKKRCPAIGQNCGELVW
jgi:hypothetical protein